VPARCAHAPSHVALYTPRLVHTRALHALRSSVYSSDGLLLRCRVTHARVAHSVICAHARCPGYAHALRTVRSRTHAPCTFTAGLSGRYARITHTRCVAFCVYARCARHTLITPHLIVAHTPHWTVTHRLPRTCRLTRVNWFSATACSCHLPHTWQLPWVGWFILHTFICYTPHITHYTH